MKKHTEKQPIDDLFARKLDNMSLHPNPNGWEILQERMGQNPVRRIVPVWYRYAAVAAGLVVVAGFGWLALPKLEINSNKEQVAAKSTKAQNANQLKPITEQTPKLIVSGRINQPESPVQEKTYALNEQESKQQIQKPVATKVVEKVETKAGLQPSLEITSPTIANSTEPVVAKVNQSAERQTDIAGQQLDKKPAERTLIVNIDVPTVALTANQPVEQKQQTLMNALNTDENVKGEKPTKAARFFRMLRQLKDGNEAMAYNSNKNDEDEESGLITRLYGNVKHSIDSKKAEKR